MPLVNPDRTPFDSREAEKRATAELIRDNILPDIPSLYQDGSKTALIISHAHQDHYGLMSHISPSCPVWLGSSAQLLIELTNNFTGKEWTIQNAHHFEHEKKFAIGDIEITPYLVDHAAYDAYAFFIQSGGKSLFYSGDFRRHGRKGKLFTWFCTHFKEDVDYLLLEGSTIGRTDKPFETESELEEKFVKAFEETKGINLVYVSGQNIDRLVTIYRACKRTQRTFVIDFYVANVLKTLNKKSNESIPCPSKSFPEIKVYFPSSLTKLMIGRDAETVYPFTAYKIGKEKLDEMAEKLVMIVRPAVQRDLERYLHKYTDGLFIYSMWHGYKDKPGAAKDFLDFIAGKGMPINEDIHTSGHADISGLKMMADAVKPKHLVPIHTFDSEEYPELFKGFDVVMVNDKEEISI
jgi:ribonuclease J